MQTPTHPTRRKGRSPATVRDSAPVLEAKGRKVRANMASPAPSIPADAGAMPAHERAVIEAALAILKARLREPGAFVKGPRDVRDLARVHLAGLELEVFGVMLFDARLGLIAFEEVSRGTLTQTTVHPREVVRLALRHNAASVILVHNHPSGSREASEADIHLTDVLRRALALIDVATHDHLIVAGIEVTSLAERGLM